MEKEEASTDNTKKLDVDDVENDSKSQEKSTVNETKEIEVTAAAAAALEETENQDPENSNNFLEYSWTLWFDSHQRGQSQQTYGQSRRKVYTFSTVQDFWKLFNNITKPSEFMPNADYYLFKDGIEPEWEHELNEKGGCWSITLDKNASKTPTLDVDEMWYNACLAMIGEQFEEGEEICGLVCSIRSRGRRLQLWSKSSDREDIVMSIGNQFKKVIGINEFNKLGFTCHDDNIKGNSKGKDKYNL